MKHLITSIIGAVLIAGMTNVTAGYNKASYFESVRTHNTLSQEAAYQLGVEALRNLSAQKPVALHLVSLQQAVKGSFQTGIDKQIHKNLSAIEHTSLTPSASRLATDSQ